MIVGTHDTAYTILGSTGFIGSNIAARLQSQGLGVYAPSRDFDQYGKIYLGNVIYCIGLTADFRYRPFETIEAHVCVLKKILETAKFDTLTYLSSTRLYVNANDTKEDSEISVAPHRLDDLYTLSKLTGESLCHQSRHENIKIARLSNIIGLRDDADIFIDQMLDEIVTANCLHLETSIESSKDYLYIDDAVDAVIELATSRQVGCFNVASGENTTTRTIIEYLKSEFKFDLLENPDGQVISAREIEIDKLREAISFAPKPFSTYFPEYLKLYKQRRKL